MFKIVLLWCIINTELIVVIDAYHIEFENDHMPIRKVLPGAKNVEEKKLTAKNHPAPDFFVHTPVNPKIYHGREKRELSTTLEKNGKHTNYIEITMDIDGAKLILDLTLNNQLIPHGFFHKHQMNGKYETLRPNLQETNLCEYIGKVRGVQNSWVALSTCEGISGVIFDGNELHYVEKGTNIESSTETDHFLYSHSNLAMNNRSCGFGDGDDHEHVHSIDNRIMRYKRFANQSTVLREPYNANEESRYVELLLVMDNELYKEHGESQLRTLNYAKNIANIVNALYARLNIFVALVGVVTWSEYDEIIMTSDGDRTLTNFLKYRREKLMPKYANDNAQLITKQNFEGGVVAKSLKGPICTFEYSGGVNTHISSAVGIMATTVAHSLGHNFGMEHDTPDCKCPKERCIMTASVLSDSPTDWSSCSVDYVKLAFSRGMDYCLRNIPKWLFDGPVCGNGFLEEGEQCDCGLPEYCNNSCCNAETCTMRSNATCAHGKCCDIETCSLKAAGTLCRSANSECDLEEYCSGYSEICPVDYHKLDAEVCDSGNAYCYHGSCKSRDDQCKLLWGETGKSSDSECYNLNTKGSRFGNCGYDKLNHSYNKCENESRLCGLLHCTHFNERLEFGLESVAMLSHSFIQKRGHIIPCRNALVDLGLDQIDPGLTPNGAPCGLGQMCVNQKCISVSGLRNQGPSCLRDCNGNGWCNNKGNCHCKAGFAPPHCDYPGPGGSLDSGPASDPKALWNRQPTSSPAITNTTKNLTDTATSVDDLSVHLDDAGMQSSTPTLFNTITNFNETVTNVDDTGLESDTTTDSNDEVRNLNNTSMNTNNTTVTSGTPNSQPEDTVSSSNTPSIFNNNSKISYDLTMHPDDTNSHSNNSVTALDNVAATSEKTALGSNDTITNSNDNKTTSDSSVTARMPLFLITIVQIVF